MKTVRLYDWLGKVKVFPSYFRSSLTSRFPSPAPPSRAPLGSSVTLWLICWSFVHSLCCNCSSLVALAFHVPLMFRRESAATAEAPALSGKQKNTRGTRGTLADQQQRFDVVFESPASPTVLYQLSLTGNMSGPYLRGEESTYRDLQTDPRWKRNKLSKLCL